MLIRRLLTDEEHAAFEARRRTPDGYCFWHGRFHFYQKDPGLPPTWPDLSRWVFAENLTEREVHIGDGRTFKKGERILVDPEIMKQLAARGIAKWLPEKGGVPN